MVLNGPDNPQKLPLPMGNLEHHLMDMVPSLGPHESPPPSNGISISSAVFVGLSDSLTIRLTDRPTDKTRYYICHNRPMWPHNNSNKVSP